MALAPSRWAQSIVKAAVVGSRCGTRRCAAAQVVETPAGQKEWYRLERPWRTGSWFRFNNRGGRPTRGVIVTCRAFQWRSDSLSMTSQIEDRAGIADSKVFSPATSSRCSCGYSAPARSSGAIWRYFQLGSMQYHSLRKVGLELLCSGITQDPFGASRGE